MAAHLHDSVLQTLALIQRHADDPQAGGDRLARSQERELRAWLYDAATSCADGPHARRGARGRLAGDVEADPRA